MFIPLLIRRHDPHFTHLEHCRFPDIALKPWAVPHTGARGTKVDALTFRARKQPHSQQILSKSICFLLKRVRFTRRELRRANQTFFSGEVVASLLVSNRLNPRSKAQRIIFYSIFRYVMLQIVLSDKPSDEETLRLLFPSSRTHSTPIKLIRI